MFSMIFYLNWPLAAVQARKDLPDPCCLDMKGVLNVLPDTAANVE